MCFEKILSSVFENFKFALKNVFNMNLEFSKLKKRHFLKLQNYEFKLKVSFEKTLFSIFKI